MKRRPLFCAILLAHAIAAHGATTTQKKIGGSGPIDRPTAHVSYWCFNEWSCGLFDTFTADGDSALVTITARNWNSLIPSLGMDIRLDNFYVVEQSSHNAEMDHVGSLDVDYGCAISSDLMLDIDNVIPVGVAYGTKFSGSIGAEWSYDPLQVSYLPSGIYEDPFDTNAPITTGAMKIGSGSGPEFNTVELQLSGLTQGWTYVISYWWRSADDGEFPANCAFPNDDFEIEIFGEEVICTPDPPQVQIDQLRTLAWDSATGIWRFQLLLRNLGSGPANGLGITLEDADAGIAITEGFTGYGDLPPSPTAVWTGPLEVDLSGYVGGGSMWLQFLLEFDDDCASYVGQYVDYFAPSDPLRNLVSSPPAGKELDLRQNKPNPFNPRTSIEFTLTRQGLVDLEIFDVRGRIVRRLVHQALDAGDHHLVWDGRDASGAGVAAGPYFYRLQSGGASVVKRMVLLK
ncbi:MAG TPA: FlgD immunoglobulin-like domain containing protein [Candidatus Krumholzibacteria bacterium]|jgi:hypothetical protein